jgi:hypothetical protein
VGCRWIVTAELVTDSKVPLAQANDKLEGYVPSAVVVPAGFQKNSGKHKVGATEDQDPAWPLQVATTLVAGNTRNKWSA